MLQIVMVCSHIIRIDADDHQWLKEIFIPAILKETAYKCLVGEKISDREMIKIARAFIERNW